MQQTSQKTSLKIRFTPIYHTVNGHGRLFNRYAEIQRILFEVIQVKVLFVRSKLRQVQICGQVN